MKKILLVEDEILIQKSLMKLLQKKGNEVTALSKGKDAVDCMLKNDFDRIICDLMLQDITGFEILEEAKKKYSLEEIGQKFVIMTAYTSNQVLKKAATYGCHIISKPFSNMNLALEEMVV